MKNVPIAFTLNGRMLNREVPSNQILADFIRENENLLGTKLSCDQSVCGACTVLVDDEPWSACTTFTFEIDKRDGLTIEGLADGDNLSAVQKAFLTNSAFQCGYCTPGMIMLATSLLKINPNPDEEMIRNWMGANICRCTGYQMIIEAVQILAGNNS